MQYLAQLKIVGQGTIPYEKGTETTAPRPASNPH